MNDLPEGWATAKVKDLFEAFGGGTPNKGTPHFWNGNIPWLSSGDIKTETVQHASNFITEDGLRNSSAKTCRHGSVLVVVRSGILKHTLPVAILQAKAAINQDIKCFDSGNLALNRWLALSLRAYARRIPALNREGTTVQSVKYETLKDFDLRLPPLAEQGQIVHRLEQLFGRVEACQKRLAKIPVILKRFRQSVLAAACSGRLTADWREKLFDQQTSDLAQNDLGSANSHDHSGLPREWRWVMFSELVSDSFYGPRFAKEEYGIQGTPTIRTTDIDDQGRIALRDPPRIALSSGKLEALGLKHEDLLVTRTGTIGKCALYDESIGPALPSAYLIRFRLSRQTVSARYVLLFLLSPSGQALLTGGTTAVAQPNVNARTIGGFRVPLPPLEEQLEIVRRVAALLWCADEIAARYQTADAQVEKMTQSILAKAFRGELVPTEAELARLEGRDYEPASVLLDRIHKDRGQAVGRTETRRVARGAKRE